MLIPEMLNCSLFISSGTDQVLMRVVQFILIQFQLRLCKTKLLLKALLRFLARLGNLLVQLRDAPLTGHNSCFCRLQALGDLPRLRRQWCRILRGVLKRRRECCVNGVIRQP
jgi:hypothetical protein